MCTVDGECVTTNDDSSNKLKFIVISSFSNFSLKKFRNAVNGSVRVPKNSVKHMKCVTETLEKRVKTRGPYVRRLG